MTSPSRQRPEISAAEPFAAHYAALAERLPGAEPAWLRALRDGAIERFTQAGFPTPRVEAWKYTNLRPLHKHSFEAALADHGAISVDAVPSILPRGKSAARLVLVNGRLRPDLSEVDGLPEGASLINLRDALASDAAGIEALLAENDAPMVALNTALMEDGYVLRVARGVVVERPIEIVFLGGLAERPLAYHPRNLVLLEDNSQAALIEHHVGRGETAYFANTASEIRLGAGARLRHLKVQEESLEGFHLASLRARLARDASYETFGLSIGGRLSRNEIAVRLEGEGAHCRVNGAYIQRGGQHCDNTTVIDHLAPHTSCREVFKGVLDDKARGVFQGRIVVHPDAQHIDGHQLSKALLLADGAEFDAKPELEIYADDVKCSHGATSGEIDHDALFYLRSRGMSETAARNLLIQAFLGEALDELENQELRADLMARITDWLPKA